MNYDRVERECVVCLEKGYAPDILPYLGRNNKHTWAHQKCAHLTKPIPEVDMPGWDANGSPQR